MTAVQPTMPTNTPTTGTRSRRDVLCGLMVALVAPGAVVAACADSEPTGSGNSNDTGTGNSTPTGGGSAPGGSAQGLTALADVPDGGGLIVENPSGGMVLVVRNGTEVTGYNAACTHMGTTLEPPKDGVATCPNHGSQFDTASGDVKNGPATKPLQTVAVKVDGDQVVLA